MKRSRPRKPRPEPKFRHINWTVRLKIEALYNAGHTYKFISSQTGYSVPTIFREVHRGLYDHLDSATWKYLRKYSAEIAQQDADWQSSGKGRPLKLGKNYAYAQHIAQQLKDGHSPDQITGQLRRLNQWTVSTPTLYRYIDRGFIPGITNTVLREKPDRKRKHKQVKKASRASKGPSIERRPQTVYARSEFGHWEMDCVIGKSEGERQTLLVLTERKTRFEIIRKLHDKTTRSVTTALKTITKRYPPNTFQTLTVDNGSEFQDYKTMKKCVPEIYYCHPYCSSERGSNENANRLVRRFFPKGTSLYRVTQKDCDRAQAAINAMPRKVLQYATAQELFDQELKQLQ